MPIKHAFTSAKSDGGDATLVRPSNWNANHDIDYVDIPEAAAPGTPATGNVRLYAKTDGNLYQKDDAGTETGLAGGGGGAPTDAKYVTTATDGTLSAEVVIPGLAGSPDIRVAGANDDEFDTTDTTDPITGWTTLGTLNSLNTNSDALSHLHLRKAAASGVNIVGVYKSPPGQPYTVTAKLTDALNRADFNSAGLFIGAATPGAIEWLHLAHNASADNIQVDAYTNPTTYSSTPVTAIKTGGPPIYLRIIVTSNTNVAYYYSANGLVWRPLITGRNPGFTIGAVGLGVGSENATYDGDAYFDWIRFT